MTAARTGLFVPLDVDFYTDSKLIEAGPVAGYLYLSALALSKRTMSDGFIADAQLATLTVNFPGKASTHADRLVDVGLWLTVAGGWSAPAFTKRNPTKADVEKKRTSKQLASLKGNHDRWHINGRTSDECPHCIAGAIRPESEPDRTPHPVGSPETESVPETETQTEAAASDAVESETQRRITDRRRRGHDIGPKLEALIRDDVERDLAIQATTEPVTPPRWTDCGDCNGVTFLHDDDLDLTVPCPKCRPAEHDDVRHELERARTSA